MNGFEIFLCVLAGIILLFILILSIPVHVSFSYQDKIYLSVRYLFLEFQLLPRGEKKEKKPKKEKKKKEKTKPETPAQEEAPKEKKPNALLQMVKANGYDGMMDVLASLARVQSRYFSQIFKSVVFDEFDIYVVVGKGDAAATAIEYGKACQNIYPLAGFLCSNHVVHKYDVSVECDFLANKSQGEFFFDFHLIVRKVLNATIAMGVRMIFRVLLKFLKNARTPAASAQPAGTNEKVN